MPVSSDGRTRRHGIALTISLALVIAARPQATSPLVGAWWESGWKLCNPVTQLRASDMDTPIEDLTFRDDGTFSVTWRGGGGAHTGDVPHVFLPDYSGHYTVDAGAHTITMRIDNGLLVPRDFEGDGTFAVSGRSLTLTHVWFGTRQASRRPDVCELTFTRK